MLAITRHHLAGTGATIDSGGNLIGYSGTIQDLFMNPAAGDFRIKDASVPAGIGAYSSGAPPAIITGGSSSGSSSGGGGGGGGGTSSVGMIAALAIGAAILLGSASD